MESDLSKPVSDWLRAQGFTPYAEVPFPMSNTNIDLVGRDSAGELITVELKRSLTKHVIHQAYMCDLITSRRYAAVGTRPKPAGIAECRRVGIGLLSVCEHGVRVLVEPREMQPLAAWIRDTYRESVNKNLDVMTPDGIGGRPCMKGEGPAQECYDRVSAYRAEHPAATWREVFQNVPNHYEHYKSMCGAMRVVEESRRKRTPLALQSQDSLNASA